MSKKPLSTVVYDTFWGFASERQSIFYNRYEGRPKSDWTFDPILSRHKFTNVYRATDRVSQYLIQNVIYRGDQSPQEVFFRTILFKLFNRVETWELLSNQLGGISWQSYDFEDYDRVLSGSMSNGGKLYSGAYIMASGRSAFGFEKKHRNHLSLLAKMMNDGLPAQIHEAPNLESVYKLLKSQPSIGEFLAYQYSIDLNYSTLINFSENDFVMPGPGALRGIEKCFSDPVGMSPSDIIRHVTDAQETECQKRGLNFRNLWGRAMTLIDIQNVFCEVDKYARVFHPEIGSRDGRKRIKQIFRPSIKPISYWFPPKWGINSNIENEKQVIDGSLF